MATAISNWIELASMSGNLTEDYYLVNDLDSSTSGYSGIGDSWTPIGTQANPFDGTFNGSGYSISDIIINIGIVGVGLFGESTSSCVIENLAILNIDITTTSSSADNVGAVVGYAPGITRNCYASGTIDAPSSDRVGGLVGNASFGTVSNCYSTVDIVDANQHVGGFAGIFNNILENCYATGGVTGSTNVGGFAGTAWLAASDAINCGWLNHDGNPSIAISLDNRTVSTSAVTYETTTLSDFYDHGYGVYSGWVFTGETPTWFEHVDSLPTFETSNYWTIHNWTDLQDLNNKLSYSAYLQNDLSSATTDYSGLGDDWTQIGPEYVSRFTGTLNGNGYSISDIKITGQSGTYKGLFGYIHTNGTAVENLALKNI